LLGRVEEEDVSKFMVRLGVALYKRAFINYAGMNISMNIR